MRKHAATTATKLSLIEMAEAERETKEKSADRKRSEAQKSM
jgi:hypothetical protein